MRNKLGFEQVLRLAVDRQRYHPIPLSPANKMEVENGVSSAATVDVKGESGEEVCFSLPNFPLKH